MELKYRPTPNRLLVLSETKAAEEKTTSGIYIPPTAQSKEPFSKGVIVGIDKTGHEESPLEEGMLIVYPTNSGVDVMVNDVKHRLLRLDEPVLYGSK